MLDAKSFRITSVADCRLFLQIEKNYCGSYLIKVSQSTNYEFISVVVEMLQKYGDVFAAYVNTINPHLSLTEKENLIKVFSTTIEDLTVIVTKTDDSHPDHNWGSSEVNHLQNLSEFTEYQGHLYLFTRKPK